MLFEIVTTSIMGGIALKAYVKKQGLATNDSGKIQRIISLSGLNVKDGKDTLTTQLIRKKKFEGFWEYKFRLPLGRSFQDFQGKMNVIEDGLNNRRKRITLNDLKELQFDSNIIDSLKNLWAEKLTESKEIEMSFDGLLIIRIYDESMPTLINWDESLLKPNTWSVPIGFLRNKEVIRHDFDKDKHLIVAGATGYGKSVILKLITTTLIKQQPEHVELSLIDLKGGSAFHRFRNCKQVKYYSRDPESAEDVLKSIQIDMNKSFKNVVDNGYEDVKEAKIKKRNFVIIDEAADLAEYKEAMSIITDIARRGRSAGYYLIYCTQYPTMQVILPQTKRNIISRLCYVVDTDTASRVVLDEGGADMLPDIAGRGIYKNNVKRYTVQSPYISNETIHNNILPHIKEKVAETPKPTENVIRFIPVKREVVKGEKVVERQTGTDIITFEEA